MQFRATASSQGSEQPVQHDLPASSYPPATITAPMSTASAHQRPAMPTTRATAAGHQKAYSLDSRWNKSKPGLDASQTDPFGMQSRVLAKKDDPDRTPCQYPPHKTTAQGFPVNNKLKKAKYATSVDDRGYLSVYEFELNDQTIMWDYHTGLVHLTGIWKALGNNKTDIVRLIETHPELEGVIQRIRGGYLKIQGTWVPFDLCRTLALRTCYSIRHALISVFGPEFPDQCLKPDAKGYGTLTLNDAALDAVSAHRRRRAATMATVNSTAKTMIDAATKPVGRQRSMSLKDRMGYRPSPYGSTSGKRSAGSPVLAPLQLSNATTPPALPKSVALEGFYYPTKTEILDLLQATRSLQQLSTGLPGASAAWTRNDPGGQIIISGTLYEWDGNDEISIVGSTAGTQLRTDGASRPESVAMMPSLSHSASSALSALPSASSVLADDESCMTAFDAVTPYTEASLSRYDVSMTAGEVPGRRRASTFSSAGISSAPYSLATDGSVNIVGGGGRGCGRTHAKRASAGAGFHSSSASPGTGSGAAIGAGNWPTTVELANLSTTRLAQLAQPPQLQIVTELQDLRTTAVASVTDAPANAAPASTAQTSCKPLDAGIGASSAVLSPAVEGQTIAAPSTIDVDMTDG